MPCSSLLICSNRGRAGISFWYLAKISLTASFTISALLLNPRTPIKVSISFTKSFGIRMVV